jgi:hypothetical protein
MVFILTGGSINMLRKAYHVHRLFDHGDDI